MYERGRSCWIIAHHTITWRLFHKVKRATVEYRRILP